MDGPEGWTADEVFKGNAGYSFDEIAFLPGDRLNEDAASKIDLATRMCRNAPKEKMLQTPFITASSASVTESVMAIAIALQGGVGFIHRQQSVNDQAAMIRRVKMHEVGFIMDPCVVGPNVTLEHVKRVTAQRGCGSVVITHNGRLTGKLVGIATTRDIEACEDATAPVHTFMGKDIESAQMPLTLTQARTQMSEKKVGKLPIVSKDNELQALVCRGDLKKAARHPKASRDRNSMLLVGASVGTRNEDDFNRSQALLEAGVDVLFLDISETGITDFTLSMIKRLKEGDLRDDGSKTQLASDIIIGPVISCQQAKTLLEQGADGITVGGEAVERCKASTLYEIAKYARSEFGAPVIADIGAKNASEAVKALCLGAHAVFLDKLLEGTEESPGNHYYHHGVRVKMRLGAEGKPPDYPDDSLLSGGPVRETGMVKQVVDKGSMESLIPHLENGLKSTLQELGVANIASIGSALAQGVIRLERQMSCVAGGADHSLRFQRTTAGTCGLNRW